MPQEDKVLATITVTPAAQERLQEFIAKQPGPVAGLRVLVRGGG